MQGVIHLWVASYGRAALVLAFAFCLGYPVCRKIVRGLAGAVLTVLAGLAVLSLIVCLLGWLHLFYGGVLVAIAVVGAGATIYLLFVDLRGRHIMRPPGTVIFSVGALLIALLAFSGLTLYPSTSLAYDATSYHLPLARDLIQHHGLSYDPFVRYSFFPQGNEAVFAVMQLLSSSAVRAASLEYSVLALAVVLLPLWFHDTGRNPLAGLIGGLLVLASPVVIWSGTAAMVDVWTMAFVLSGLLVGLDAVQGRGRTVPMMVLCGVLLGEAAASKYTGGLFAACALVGILIAAGRAGIRPGVLLALVGGGAVVALPWYAWTLHTTGDPVYPFAVGLFGNRHGLWTSSEISYQDFSVRGDIKPGVGAIVSRDWQYLTGSIAYLPGPVRSPLSWWLAAGFLPLLARSSRRQRAYVGVAVASLLCLIISIFISADPRYLVPALGIVALCGALAADWAFSAAGRILRVAARPLVVAGAAVALGVALLWSSASYGIDFASNNGAPPTSAADVNGFIAARTPCYPAVVWLNGRLGGHWRAWSYNCEDARYYAKGKLIGDVFSTGSVFRVFNDGLYLPDAHTLWSRLAPLSVRWLILPVSKVPSPRALDQSGYFAFVARVGVMDVFTVT